MLFVVQASFDQMCGCFVTGEVDIEAIRHRNPHVGVRIGEHLLDEREVLFHELPGDGDGCLTNARGRRSCPSIANVTKGGCIDTARGVDGFEETERLLCLSCRPSTFHEPEEESVFDMTRVCLPDENVDRKLA